MGLRCKRCGSEEHVKNGFMKGLQRYRCKACGLNFTDTPPRGLPLRVKVTAVLLYLSGLSMNRTAKLLGVSTPSVMTWIEQFADVYAQEPEPEGRAVVVELDEMWRFLEKSGTSSGCGRLGIVLRDGSSTGSRAVVTRPLSNDCSSACSAGASVSTARTTGRPTARRSRRGVSTSARRRRTGSSATIPGSGTGWPGSGAAPASCPGPSAWWTPRSRCSSASVTRTGSANSYLCSPKTLLARFGTDAWS